VQLDVTDTAEVARALSAAAASGSRIIIHLAGLTFTDCNSLSALVSARKQALQEGGDLLLAAPRRTALRLLSLIDPDGLPPEFASVEQAANGARRPTASDRLVLHGCMVKRRWGMVRLTRCGPKHRRPGRGRSPPVTPPAAAAAGRSGR
jgi:anti-anti-sigma factor